MLGIGLGKVNISSSDHVKVTVEDAFMDDFSHFCKLLPHFSCDAIRIA